MTQENNSILQELKGIKEDLNYLKKHVTDIDVVLTSDDEEALMDAEIDLKTSKTKRLV
jgi:hypothetical protein